MKIRRTKGMAQKKVFFGVKNKKTNKKEEKKRERKVK